MTDSATSSPILQVTNLKKHFPVQKGFLQRTVGHVKAVDDVTFDVLPGETMALVGESGCGKTTTGHCIMRGHTPTAGQILFHDPARGTLDICRADRQTLAYIRQKVQMVFQDPYSSLNPRMTVREIVGEPLRVNQGLSGRTLQERVEELLTVVGLHASAMNRFPHAFSGGQRQRLVIARALSLRPALIVADEPTSALDVVVQRQVMTTLSRVQRETGAAVILIGHDMGLVAQFADRIGVMYAGKLVDIGTVQQIIETPKHPYTRLLINSVPDLEERRERLEGIPGIPPPLVDLPPGCVFAPRCPLAQTPCTQVEPRQLEVEPERWVACHIFDDDVAVEERRDA